MPTLEIWEPQPPGTLRASPGLYRDGFTFYISRVDVLYTPFYFQLLHDVEFLRKITHGANVVYVYRGYPLHYKPQVSNTMRCLVMFLHFYIQLIF